MDIIHHKLQPLPPEEDIVPDLRVLTSAHHALGEIKGRITRDVINPNLIIAPLLTKEAVASSKIEGTQTTVEEVLKYEAEPTKREDSELLEIINYRQAIRESVEFLKKKPLGEHLIRKLHATLMASVRGREKDPGNFRKIAVHIGKPGRPAQDAAYVPPQPVEITSLMKNWVEFAHKEELDPLIQAGIAHYQFEAIHPFMDGNGRIGRLLIPILLYANDVIPYPYLYVSDFFEQHRSDYYEALRGVDRNRDWNSWIHLFLYAITETSAQMQEKVSKMYELYRRLKDELLHLNSQYAQLLLDLLFEHPIISSKEALKQLDQPSRQTVYNLIEKFEEQEILYEITGNRRNKVYAFRELVDIIQ
ncbi:MAG TPA: Fic family protein [Balneolaceae bacterium]